MNTIKYDQIPSYANYRTQTELHHDPGFIRGNFRVLVYYMLWLLHRRRLSAVHCMQISKLLKTGEAYFANSASARFVTVGKIYSLRNEAQTRVTTKPPIVRSEYGF